MDHYFNYSVSDTDHKEVFCECVVNGERRSFDAADDGDLEEAKEAYKNVFEYFGSGLICYYNGRKTIHKKLNHFFKRK
jgi:hypothetical protein